MAMERMYDVQLQTQRDQVIQAAVTGSYSRPRQTAAGAYGEMLEATAYTTLFPCCMMPDLASI